MAQDGDWLKLDDQLCFALYGASRSVVQLYQPLLAPLGLTYPQYLVLLVLWEEDGAAMRRLGERLLLDSGTRTPLVTRLQESGLVERRRSTEDARVVGVWLTAAGKRLKKQAKNIPGDLFCQLGLSVAELAHLRRELQRLIEMTRADGAQKEKTP
jgi:MarR family transcriptional regulator, organic hydroperoxide resistance regulator